MNPYVTLAADVLIKGSEALHGAVKNEQSQFKAIFKAIYRYPIKLLATFIFSPFLIVLVVKNSNLSAGRRAIALVGIISAVIAGYAAFTYFGTIGGLILVASNIGFLSGIGFLLGTLFSVYFTVIFSVLLINLFCTLFLKIGSDDVVEYLKEIVAMNNLNA